MIHGIPVQLCVRTRSGTDAFGAPLYAEEWVEVSDVLVGEGATDTPADTTNLSGRRVFYTLAIPKGDAHIWTDTRVRFWGKEFETVGVPVQGIDANIPLRWNKQVRVSCYE